MAPSWLIFISTRRTSDSTKRKEPQWLRPGSPQHLEGTARFMNHLFVWTHSVNSPSPWRRSKEMPCGTFPPFCFPCPSCCLSLTSGSSDSPRGNTCPNQPLRPRCHGLVMDTTQGVICSACSCPNRDLGQAEKTAQGMTEIGWVGDSRREGKGL